MLPLSALTLFSLFLALWSLPPMAVILFIYLFLPGKGTGGDKHRGITLHISLDGWLFAGLEVAQGPLWLRDGPGRKGGDLED